MRKLVGVLFIGLSLFFLYSSWPQARMYHSEYLFAKRWVQSWESQLKNPKNIGLPDSWNDIRSVTLYPTHWQHTFWLKWVDLPVPIHSKGKFHLDILMMSWEEEELRFVVLQYNLKEVGGHGNTVWEGGQTFKLHF